MNKVYVLLGVLVVLVVVAVVVNYDASGRGRDRAPAVDTQSAAKLPAIDQNRIHAVELSDAENRVQGRAVGGELGPSREVRFARDGEQGHRAPPGSAGARARRARLEVGGCSPREDPRPRAGRRQADQAVRREQQADRRPVGRQDRRQRRSQPSAGRDVRPRGGTGRRLLPRQAPAAPRDAAALDVARQPRLRARSQAARGVGRKSRARQDRVRRRAVHAGDSGHAARLRARGAHPRWWPRGRSPSRVPTPSRRRRSDPRRRPRRLRRPGCNATGRSSSRRNPRSSLRRR